MAQTTLSSLINPQVMGDMISASLPKAIKFAPLAKIDTTLTGRAGNTITVPKFAYIGDAEDVAEGIAMGTTVLTASSTTATVKKAGKAVEITDESALSGYGDPVGEANSQLIKSIAAKVDNDCVTALGAATLTYDGSAAIISYNGVVDALDKFQEEDYEAKVLFVHPSQVTQLRKDADFKDINKYPLQTVMTGVIGEIAGCQVVPSKKVAVDTTNYTNFIVKAGALTIYMKKDVDVETDRDILAKTTVISADEHYVAVLSDASKAVKVTFKKA
jgi:N4-gp56 family major capsid protein